MATIIVLVAFWLILVGIYGGVSLLREESLGRRPLSKPLSSRRAPRFAHALLGREDVAAPEPREAWRPVVHATPSAPAAERPAVAPAVRQSEGVGSLFSEVDMLRAQVEHLRSEICAISSRPERIERPRTRRYRPGTYTYLPLILRRHVHDARQVRRPLGI